MFFCYHPDYSVLSSGNSIEEAILKWEREAGSWYNEQVSEDFTIIEGKLKTVTLTYTVTDTPDPIC
jgi:hypothetical protein